MPEQFDTQRIRSEADAQCLQWSATGSEAFLRLHFCSLVKQASTRISMRLKPRGIARKKEHASPLALLQRAANGRARIAKMDACRLLPATIRQVRRKHRGCCFRRNIAAPVASPEHPALAAMQIHVRAK